MTTLDKSRPNRNYLIAAAALLTVAGAACSMPFGPRSGAATGGAPTPAVQPPKQDLKFPNHDLAAMYDAAKASPQDFDAVHSYAKALAAYCQGALVDANCGPYCAGGRVRYKPASALDPDLVTLVENALPKLDALMSTPAISWAQMGQWVAVKGRLLGLHGRAAEEKTLIDDYALQHPEALPVVRRRLELLREAQDTKESEAQCTRSRQSARSSTEDTRLELLAACVSLHPENQGGKEDTPDFTKYLPKLAGDEQRLYRKYMARRCEQDAGSHAAHCSRICACDDQPWDKKYTAHCKEVCKGCREQATAKLKSCKKYRGR